MFHIGYALWLVPSEAEYGALQHLMNFRPQPSSPRAHSSRSFPRFDPHITLATFSSPPSLPLPELLPSIKATPVYFESIKVGSGYLGSLSVVASKSPELMDLHDYILRHLNTVHRIRTASRSFPHMSLFYLDEAARGERIRLANILRSSGRVVEQRGGTGVALNCTLDGAAPQFHAMTGFVGSEIWLVDCAGGVADWKVLEKRKLVRRNPCIPMSEPFFDKSGPVIPMLLGHPGSDGCAPHTPYIERADPFFHKPNPVIPMKLYHYQDPR
jgi:hypothetical protein